jgi:hypothetical protein
VTGRTNTSRCAASSTSDDEEWGFALYSAATDSYTDSLLHTGADVGHPNDTFDTAAIVRLADHEA